MKKILTILLVICAFQVQAQQSGDSTTYQKRPFHIGFFYPLSTNGADAANYVNNISLHAFSSLSAGVDGIELAGFMNTTKDYVLGLQGAGFMNIVDGNVRGMQGAGFMNISGGLTGLQGAGFMNISSGSSNGLQGAGFMNINHGGIKGLQNAGFMNIASGSVKGIQNAGFMNISEEMLGIQTGGFMNISESLTGCQLAGFGNIAEDVTGAQFAGFINIANRVKGVQVAGFINIADSSDYPIGVINIIKTGTREISVWTNELLATNVSFKSGGRRTYGIIGLGYSPKFPKSHVNMHAGLGVNMLVKNKFKVQLEAVTQSLISDNENNELLLNAINVLGSIKLAPRISLFGGPSINHYIGNDAEMYNNIKYDFWSYIDDAETFNYQKVWIGFAAGISIRIDKNI